MDQYDVLCAAERLSLLFGLLDSRIAARRSGNVLSQIVARYQYYFTNDFVLNQSQLVSQGQDILRIYRLISAIEALYERPIDAGIKNHSLFKEVEDLFAKAQMPFENTEFNIFSASYIAGRTGLAVQFIRESSQEKESTPDLQVAELAYVECKDLQSTNKQNLASNITCNMGKACSQLRAAQGRSQLLGAGVCLDIPKVLHPFGSDAWRALKKAMENCPEIGFVLVSMSSFKCSGDELSFPHEVSLIIRPDIPCKLRESVALRLASHHFEWDGARWVCMPHD